MTKNEATFMTSASELADTQLNDPLFIGNVDPLVAALNQKGMSDKQISECHDSLERGGYITSFTRPIGLTGLDVFKITSKGLKWWLIHQHGDTGYSKMVNDVKKARDERLKTGVSTPAAIADRLKLPLLLVQKLFHAEKL